MKEDSAECRKVIREKELISEESTRTEQRFRARRRTAPTNSTKRMLYEGCSCKMTWPSHLMCTGALRYYTNVNHEACQCLRSVARNLYTLKQTGSDKTLVDQFIVQCTVRIAHQTVNKQSRHTPPLYGEKRWSVHYNQTTSVVSIPHGSHAITIRQPPRAIHILSEQSRATQTATLLPRRVRKKFRIASDAVFLQFLQQWKAKVQCTHRSSRITIKNRLYVHG